MNYKNLLLIFTILFFSACSQKSLNLNTDLDIKDVTTLTQEPSIYAKASTFDSNTSIKNQEKFIKNYFAPWEQTKVSVSLEDVMWSRKYTKQKVYGENNRLISKKWFDEILDNANYELFNMNNQKAITVEESHLRVFPTNSTIFYNPKEAGEGFPFDYNENSSIKLNTPVIISHYSKDGLWAFVESNIALGWIEVKDIALVNEEFMEIFKTKNYSISIKDDVVLKKNYVVQTSVSMSTLFPKARFGYVIAGKDLQNNAFIKIIDDNKYIKPLGLEFNNDNVKLISSSLIEQPYGWGGILGNRDCSLLTRDFFIPFGVFLPRNSAAQAKVGKVYDLSKYDDEEKKEFIIKNAVPYKTLIHLKGHIMLYIGYKDSEPLVFHNVWGIRTDEDGKVGRKIIGKGVVTTLEPGKELSNYIKDKSILKRIISINIIE